MTEGIKAPENYDLHWGFASFKDKNILDIGADRGSTTYYFLQHGAKKVVAVEGNKENAKELFAYYGHSPDVTCIELMVKIPEQFEQLISKYKPDLVKCDIEGDERYLLDAPIETITSVEEWLLETHNEYLHQKFLDLFKSLYSKVTVHYENQIVIWARR